MKISDVPLLDKEYDEENNIESKNEISSHSHKSVWWVCEQQHRWKQSPHGRSHLTPEGDVVYTPCKICSRKQLLKRYNDLATICPNLANEFDKDKNSPETASDYLSRDSSFVWWKCSRNHSWHASIRTRVIDRTGCPYCSNRKILAGFNDLATTDPEFASMWDINKNDISPTEITRRSRKKFWWICQECGESFSATCDDIIRHQSKKCRECAMKALESTVAKEMKGYCAENLNGVLEYKILRNPITNMWLPYDIYLPNKKVFIEIQGQQHYEFNTKFHKSIEDFEYRKNIDKLKREYAEKNGYFVEIDIRKYNTSKKAIDYLNQILFSLND